MQKQLESDLMQWMELEEMVVCGMEKQKQLEPGFCISDIIGLPKDMRNTSHFVFSLRFPSMINRFRFICLAKF